MPRTGPRRSLVAFKLHQDDIDHIDQRAATEAGGVRSEMIRRMVAYAQRHMAAGWIPEQDPPTTTEDRSHT